MTDQAIVLVGLMGAGKSSVGRRLATALSMPFMDADAEIEAAAGCTINEIFERHGEAEFRRGEKRVIERLLDNGPYVLATGGGAFMAPEIRALVKNKAISVWLRADLDLLLRRVLKRNTRPLLKTGDPRQIMENLIETRYPTYGQADITVDCINGPHELMVDAVIKALTEFLHNKSH